ncbi:MAG: hypothetical protein HZB39_20440 [Planctomycetes bacterium]|nr:hypothetical protein [Planctomycetota bacterium]
MPRTAVLMILAALASVPACCNSPDDAPPAPNRAEGGPSGGASGGGTPVYDYEGPPIEAAITMDGGSRVLKVDVTVPSGGWEFALDGVEPIKGATGACVVKLTLTQPGADDIVTQALETHTQRVAMPEGARSCKVTVSRVQRGVHYLVAPEHKLARIVLSQ